MKKLSFRLLLTITALFLALLIAPAAHIMAQTSAAGDLSFLENFAVKIYKRGDILQAQKEFERILRIDPANMTAKKYLDEIIQGKTPAVSVAASPSLTRLNSITADIKGLKDEILQRESETRQLYLSIRGLITENDSLYTVLRKRTRDLAELREKFQGTPYDTEYSSLMKELPPDRIAQRALPLDTFPLTQIPSTALPQDPLPKEIEILTQEVAQAEAALQDQKSAPGQDLARIQQLETELRNKRSLLIDKTALLIENKDSLRSLQGELTTINQSLKDADHRYIAILENLERLAQDIRTETSLQDAETQRKHRELMADYAERIKEIEALKKEITRRDETLAPLETAWSNGQKDLAGLDSSLRVQDEKIEGYRALLLKLQNDLARKEALITEQNAALTKKESQLAEKDAALSQKDTLLSEKDSALAQKDSLLSKTEAVLSQKESLITKKTEELEKKDSLIDEKSALIAKKDASIERQDRAILKKNADLARQTEALQFTDQALDTTGEKIHSIQSLFAETDEGIRHLETGFLQIRTLLKGQAPQLSRSTGTPVIPAASGSLQSLDKRLQALADDLQKKNNDLHILQLQTANMRKELMARERESRQKDLDVLSSLEKNSSLERRLRGLQEEIKQLKKAPPVFSSTGTRPPMPRAVARLPSREIPILHDILGAKDNTITELKKEIVEKNFENQRLSAFVDSCKAIADEKRALETDMVLLNNRLIQAEEEKTLLENSRRALQKSELDIQEKNTAILALEANLQQKTEALAAADQQIALLQEHLDALKIKQDALKTLFDNRDKELSDLKNKQDK